MIAANQHLVSIGERIAEPHELGGPPADLAQKIPAGDNPYIMLQVTPDAPRAHIIASCRRLTETLLPRTMDGVNVKDTQVKSALSAAKKILNA